MNLLQMSLSGAVMILAVVVIRALAVNRLPKKAFLVLWGVSAARLLIPYSLPSAFSVYSLVGRLTPAVEAAAAVSDAPFIPAAPANDTMPLPMTLQPAVSAVHTPAVHIDPWVVVWLVGALACAVFFTAAYLKCRREFRFSLPVDNGYAKLWLGEHRIRRPIEIRQSGRISAPLTYGVFRPVILMPKAVDWDDLDTLNYVLTHEYVHILRFDAVTKLMLTSALCVHWFNPAVWIMYILANRDIELSCDEAVVRRFGERTKSAYAMALIRMEETRSGLSPLCNNFSKNAVEERITAIMKIKKTSISALITAAALVVGVTAAFATSAKADDNSSPGASDLLPGMSGTVTHVTTMTSYVDPNDGKTYYSFDGGKTFEALTEEEFKARFSVPDIEWWTYDEYKAWLENEKVELQDMIGERAWTSGRGEFVWTQEIVDETIAMYEGILEEIGNGMLYSKPREGEGDLFGMTITMSYDPADIAAGVHEGGAAAADFLPYVPYGLEWDEGEKALFWNGERVRYFLDGTYIDGSGGMAIRLEYADAELKGEIDVRAVRARVDNPDGSFDPMGPLVGLEQYSQAEFDVRTFPSPSMEAETSTAQEIAGKPEDTQALLQAYIPLGLSYRFHPITGEISMSWQGKPVHSVYDEVKAVWIANNMHGLDLGSDAVDLEAVYEQGELIGLRETDCPTAQTTFVLEGAGEAEPGTSFAELFEKYAPFGITYEEAEGASGAGNVYYNGQLVSQFADLTPEGGAFTFTSAKQGGIAVKTVYDNEGRLAGVEAAAPAPENRWGVPDGEIPRFTEFVVDSFDDAAELGRYLEATHGLYPGDYASSKAMPAGTVHLQVNYMEKESRERLPDGVYPVNSRGETYGRAADSEVVGYEPDLILAVATNGERGYVLKSDFYRGNYTGPMDTPEDAVAHMQWRETHPEPQLIPVYDVDRDNIVGYFKISGYSFAGSGLTLEEARELVANG